MRLTRWIRSWRHAPEPGLPNWAGNILCALAAATIFIGRSMLRHLRETT